MEPFDNIIDIRNIKKKVKYSIRLWSKSLKLNIETKTVCVSIWKRQGDLSSFRNFPIGILSYSVNKQQLMNYRCKGFCYFILFFFWFFVFPMKRCKKKRWKFINQNIYRLMIAPSHFARLDIESILLFVRSYVNQLLALFKLKQTLTRCIYSEILSPRCKSSYHQNTLAMSTQNIVESG